MSNAFTGLQGTSSIIRRVGNSNLDVGFNKARKAWESFVYGSGKKSRRASATPAVKTVKKRKKTRTTNDIKEQDFAVAEKPVRSYAYIPKVYGFCTVTGNVVWRTEPVQHTFINFGFPLTGMFYDIEIVYAQDCRCVEFSPTSPFPEIPELTKFAGLYDPWADVQNDAPMFRLGDMWHFWQNYGSFGLDDIQLEMTYDRTVNSQTNKTIVASNLADPPEGAYRIDFTHTSFDSQPFYIDYIRFLSSGWYSGATPNPYNPNVGIYSSRHPSLAKACLLVFKREGKIDDAIPEFYANIVVNKKKYWGDGEWLEKNGCWYKEAVLDLLRIAGFDWTVYRKSEFGIENDYDDERFYINKAFTEQVTIKDAIVEICNQVGVILYYDLETLKFNFKKAVKTEYISQAYFDEDECQIAIDSVEDADLFSTYKGHYHINQESTYVSALGKTHLNTDMVQKVTTVDNDVNRNLYGVSFQEIEMDIYRSEDPAKIRTTELMKQESWKKHFGQIVCSAENFMLEDGDAITIHAPSQVIGDFIAEITNIQLGTENMTIDWEQVAPVSEYYSEGGGGETGFGVAEIPVIDDVIIYEIPQSTRYEKTTQQFFAFNPSGILQSYLNSNQLENFRIMLFKSETIDGTYTFWKYISEYSRYWKHFTSRGLLMNTVDIDGRWKTETTESISINVTGLNYEFTQNSSVLLKINDEYIYAKTFTKAGSNYSFKGFVRAQLGTDKATHLAGATVEIIRLWTLTGASDSWFGYDASGNEIDYHNRLESDEECFIKPILLMESGLKISSIEVTAPVYLNPQQTATKPHTIGTLIAVRSGSTVNINWFARSPIADYDGAGVKRAGYMADHEPSLYEPDFMISINAGAWTTQSANTYVVNDASAFTIAVKQKDTGVEGDERLFTIGATDGTYIDGILI